MKIRRINWRASNPICSYDFPKVRSARYVDLQAYLNFYYSQQISYFKYFFGFLRIWFNSWHLQQNFFAYLDFRLKLKKKSSKGFRVIKNFTNFFEVTFWHFFDHDVNSTSNLSKYPTYFQLDKLRFKKVCDEQYDRILRNK